MGMLKLQPWEPLAAVVQRAETVVAWWEHNAAVGADMVEHDVKVGATGARRQYGDG